MATTTLRQRLSVARSLLPVRAHAHRAVLEARAEARRHRAPLEAIATGEQRYSSRRSKLTPAIFAFALLGQVHAATAATEMFLRIDGIGGESTSIGHEGWIDLLGFSQGVSQTGTFGLPGRAHFNDVSVVKYVDKATPLLWLGTAKAKQYATARIEMKAPGPGSKVFMWIDLFNVQISSVSTGGSSQTDLLPTESVSLSFERIRISYQPCNPDGTPKGGVVVVGWDVAQGQEF